MKHLKVFGLVLFTILAAIYIGANAISANYSWGPFFMFIAVCCSIGFSIDLFNHFRPRRSR